MMFKLHGSYMLESGDNQAYLEDCRYYFNISCSDDKLNTYR